MQPYEILITKTIYDDDGNEQTPNIIFGPIVVFAYSANDAVKKATVRSKITSDEINDTNFFVRAYDYEKV